jgi:(p)ppGpp synthase/HD superfamily hydrolase
MAFVADAYGARLQRPGRDVEHPIAVATLLAADGHAPPVVLAGLLHDVLEDTTVAPCELVDRFGPDVSRLVIALTQDPAIEKYRDRKAALRRQILDAGPQAATITLADKVAKLTLAQQRPRARRLAHYRATLAGVEERYGRSPLSDRLREELDRW